MDLKETDILGSDIQHHWYYRSKAEAMVRMLHGAVPDTVLDVGAGSGFFSRYLLQNTSAAEAWCVDISYSADSDENEAGKPVHYRRCTDGADADLVLFMDVLEHVDDDVLLLKEYVEKVPRGSRFLITVPAFNFLWSAHDDFLEHRRRYTLPQLEHVVRSAGLEIQNSAYYFGLIFPLAAGVRMVGKLAKQGKPSQSQLKKHHPLVNSLLQCLCSAELPLLGWNRAAGLTVFCVAMKK